LSAGLPAVKEPLVLFWIGGWVGPKAGPDSEVGEKISQPLPGLRLPILVKCYKVQFWLHFKVEFV
jgi:hypothetical protein